ncbi:MAG: hypothetical protein H0U69_03665 [Trueperaceae bacterium]|nr:hypothetical protein [Trueperaceae bacterium]
MADPTKIDDEIGSAFHALFGSGVRPANLAAAETHLARRFTDGPELSTRLWGAGQSERESIIDYLRKEYTLGSGFGETPGYPSNRILDNLRTWYTDGPSSGLRGDPTYVARRIAVTESAFFTQALDNAVDEELEAAGMIDGYEILLAPERDDWDCECPGHADGGPYPTLLDTPEPPFHPFCACRRRPIFLDEPKRKKQADRRRALTDYARGVGVDVAATMLDREIADPNDHPVLTLFKQYLVDYLAGGTKAHLLGSSPRWGRLIGRTALNFTLRHGRDYVIKTAVDAAALIQNTPRGVLLQAMTHHLARHYYLVGRERLRTMFAPRPYGGRVGGPPGAGSRRGPPAALVADTRAVSTLTPEIIENAVELERAMVLARQAGAKLGPPLSPAEFDDKIRTLLKDAMVGGRPVTGHGVFRPKPGEKWTGNEILTQVFGDGLPTTISAELTTWQAGGQIARPRPNLIGTVTPDGRALAPGARHEVEYRVWPVSAIDAATLGGAPGEVFLPPGATLRPFAVQEERGRWVVDFREMPSWSKPLAYADDEITAWANLPVGVPLEPSAAQDLVDAWRSLFPLPPMQAVEHMLFGLPVNLQRVGITGRANTINLSITTDAFTATRTFTLRDDGVRVSHDTLRVIPDRQGEGLARSFLANSVYLYEALGFKAIETNASARGDDGGAYTWARFGFTPQIPDWQAVRDRNVRVWLEQNRINLTVAEVNLIEAALANRHPRALWAIADLPIGREALLGGAGVGWRGVLDLTDLEAMQRFNAYTRRLPLVMERQQIDLSEVTIRSYAPPPDPPPAITHEDQVRYQLVESEFAGPNVRNGDIDVNAQRWDVFAGADTPASLVERLRSALADINPNVYAGRDLDTAIISFSETGRALYMDYYFRVEGDAFGTTIQLRHEGGRSYVDKVRFSNPERIQESIDLLGVIERVFRDELGFNGINVDVDSIERLRGGLGMGLQVPAYQRIRLDIHLRETITEGLAGSPRNAQLLEAYLSDSDDVGTYLPIAAALEPTWAITPSAAFALQTTPLSLILPVRSSPRRRLYDALSSSGGGPIIRGLLDRAEEIRIEAMAIPQGADVQGDITFPDAAPAAAPLPDRSGWPTEARITQMRSEWGDAPTTAQEFQDVFGQTMDDVQVAVWNQRINIRPEQFVEYLYQFAPPEMVGAYTWNWRIGHQGHVELDLRTTAGVTGVSMEMRRTFDFSRHGDHSVYHGYYRVSRDSASPLRGVARAVFSGFWDIYDHMGIARVGVSASLSRGGYVWARFGFLPDGNISDLGDRMAQHLGFDAVAAIAQHVDPNEIAATLRGAAIAEYADELVDLYESVSGPGLFQDQLSVLVPTDPDRVAEIFREVDLAVTQADIDDAVDDAANALMGAHNSPIEALTADFLDQEGITGYPDEPRMLWDIADHLQGADVLMGQSWSGTFDMNDPDQLDRFNGYVRRGQPWTDLLDYTEQITGSRHMTFSLNRAKVARALAQQTPAVPDAQLPVWEPDPLLQRGLMPNVGVAPAGVDQASFEFIARHVWQTTPTLQGGSAATHTVGRLRERAAHTMEGMVATLNVPPAAIERMILPPKSWPATFQLAAEPVHAGTVGSRGVQYEFELSAATPNPEFDPAATPNADTNPERLSMHVLLTSTLGTGETLPTTVIDFGASAYLRVTPAQMIESIGEAYRVVRAVTAEASNVQISFDTLSFSHLLTLDLADPARIRGMSELGSIFAWAPHDPNMVSALRSGLTNAHYFLQGPTGNAGIVDDATLRRVEAHALGSDMGRWVMIDDLARHGEYRALGEIVMQGTWGGRVTLDVVRERATHLIPMRPLSQPIVRLPERVLTTADPEAQRAWEAAIGPAFPTRSGGDMSLLQQRESGTIDLWLSQSQRDVWLADPGLADVQRLAVLDMIAGPRAPMGQPHADVAATFYHLLNTPVARHLSPAELWRGSGLRDVHLDTLANSFSVMLSPPGHQLGRIGVQIQVPHAIDEPVQSVITGLGAAQAILTRAEVIGLVASVAEAAYTVNRHRMGGRSRAQLALNVYDGEIAERLMRVFFEPVDPVQIEMVLTQMKVVAERSMGRTQASGDTDAWNRYRNVVERLEYYIHGTDDLATRQGAFTSPNHYMAGIVRTAIDELGLDIHLRATGITVGASDRIRDQVDRILDPTYGSRLEVSLPPGLDGVITTTNYRADAAVAADDLLRDARAGLDLERWNADPVLRQDQAFPTIVTERAARPPLVRRAGVPVAMGLDEVGLQGLGTLINLGNRTTTPFAAIVGAGTEPFNTESVFLQLRRMFDLDTLYGRGPMEQLTGLRAVFDESAAVLAVRGTPLLGFVNLDRLMSGSKPFVNPSPTYPDAVAPNDHTDLPGYRPIGRWDTSNDVMGVIIHEHAHIATTRVLHEVKEGVAHARTSAGPHDDAIRDWVAQVVAVDLSVPSHTALRVLFPSDYVFNTYIHEREVDRQYREIATFANLVPPPPLYPDKAVNEMIAESFTAMAIDADRFRREHPLLANIVDLVLVEAGTPIIWPAPGELRRVNRGAKPPVPAVTLAPPERPVTRWSAGTHDPLTVPRLPPLPIPETDEIALALVHGAAHQAALTAMEEGTGIVVVNIDAVQPPTPTAERRGGVTVSALSRHLSPLPGPPQDPVAWFAGLKETLRPGGLLVAYTQNVHVTPATGQPIGNLLDTPAERAALESNFAYVMHVHQLPNGLNVWMASDDRARLTAATAEFAARYNPHPRPGAIPPGSPLAGLRSHPLRFDTEINETFSYGDAALYHGTRIDMALRIEEEGLLPRTGDLTESVYSDYPGQVIPGAAFFVQEDRLDAFIVNLIAMRYHVGQKLDTDISKVTLRDVLEHGALIVVERYDPEEVFQRNWEGWDDDEGEERALFVDLNGAPVNASRFEGLVQIEEEDIFSLEPLPASDILVGQRLLDFFLTTEQRRTSVEEAFPGQLDDMYARDPLFPDVPPEAKRNIFADVYTPVQLLERAIEEQGFTRPSILDDLGIGPAAHWPSVREGANVIELADLLALDRTITPRLTPAEAALYTPTYLAARYGYQAVAFGGMYAVLDVDAEPEVEAAALIGGTRRQLEQIRSANPDVEFRYLRYGGR